MIRLLLVCLLFCAPLSAQSWLETVDEALTLSSAEGRWRLDVTGWVDLESYAAETQAFGLLETDDSLFFNPRLTLQLDLQMTERWRAHSQMRTDRGFDPGFAPEGQTRWDEYFLEWKPLQRDLVTWRVGKFATVFGAWTARRLSWDNPLITAPAAYSDMLPVTDSVLASAAAVAGRRDQAENRQTWVPTVWGPSYATGFSLSGRSDHVDYALEIKNAALSSRPAAWDAVENGWDATTYSGRLGWRPSPAWNFGGSFSHGSYLLEEIQADLPPGQSYRDFHQTTVGLDGGYAHGLWQIWAELMTSRFEIPQVGAVRVFTGFLEAKRKLGASTWLAARWNQSVFGDLPGTQQAWERDGWRLDLALGQRLSRQMQVKLQYSLAERTGRDQEGNHLVAMQLTLRF